MNNKAPKKFQAIMLTLCVALLCNTGATAQVNSGAIERTKAKYIYNFPKHITWPNEADLFVLDIGIVGVSKEMEDELIRLSKSGYPDGTDVRITRFNNLQGTDSLPVLVLSEGYNDKLKQIIEDAQRNHTLVISTNAKSKKLTMINFLVKNNGELGYEVNRINIRMAGMDTEKMKVDKEDIILIQDILAETDADLKNEQEKVKRKEDLLVDMLDQLKQQEIRIQEQRNQILKQRKSIHEQQTKINNQRLELDTLTTASLRQHQAIKDKEITLAEQEKRIALQRKEIEEKQYFVIAYADTLLSQKTEIDEQRSQITTQRSKIYDQSDVLENQDALIKTQQGLLYIFIAFITLVLILVFFIYRSYKVKKQANLTLESKNDKISKQKAEIQQQASELEAKNKELEQYSIAASETDNAILIADAEGKFQWVNDGYTRMFGYSFNELIHTISKTIIGPKTPEHIKSLVEECKNKKKSVTYQIQTTTKENQSIWVQTTITPYLNKDKEIEKLILIDSDISQLKVAEQQILKQRDELQMHNENIKASIRYARTIQNAILPIKEEIDRLFESFIIFWPKDIVSGDFYWFKHLPEQNRSLVAVVDCTGHGVPGAFMSLIGNRLLNEIVLEQQITDPAQILDKLNIKVQETLMQERTSNNDGMDVALCSITQNGSSKIQIRYAGAKRHMYYYEKEKKQISRIKGVSRSIGGRPRLRQVESLPFENADLTLESGDLLYLLSDGFQDQHSVIRKRFGNDRLFEIATESFDAPMEQQKLQLEVALEQHMKGTEQRDDITVLGIRL